MPSDTPLDLDAIEADAIACTARSYGPTIPKLAHSVIDLVDALRASRAEVERLRALVEADNGRWRYLRRDPNVMRYLYDLCSVETGDDGAAEMRVWIDWSVENDAKLEAEALAQPGEDGE